MIFSIRLCKTTTAAHKPFLEHVPVSKLIHSWLLARHISFQLPYAMQLAVCLGYVYVANGIASTSAHIHAPAIRRRLFSHGRDNGQLVRQHAVLGCLLKDNIFLPYVFGKFGP